MAHEAPKIAHAMSGWCIDKDHKGCKGVSMSLYPVHCPCKCHEACPCKEGA